MRWLLLVLIFIFGLAGIEMYQNIGLIRSSYQRQRLQSQVKKMEKENAFLKKELSSSLSLRNLESYVRNQLEMVDPVEVRFIREKLPPEEESVSPWAKDWGQIKGWLKEKTKESLYYFNKLLMMGKVWS